MPTTRGGSHSNPFSPARIFPSSVNMSHLLPAGAPAAEGEHNPLLDIPLCAIYQERLEAAGFDLFIGACPTCHKPVGLHAHTPPAPIPPVVAPQPPPPVPDHKQDDDPERSTRFNPRNLHKLAASLPKWEKKSVARVFLKTMENKLGPLEVPSEYWGKLLVYLVSDFASQEWISKNIIDKNLSWTDTKKVFIDHFQSADYLTSLRRKFPSMKQEADESMQVFGDRFLDAAAQLNIEDNDALVIQQLIDHVKSNIRSKLLDYRAIQRINQRDFEFTSLQGVIDALINFENSANTYSGSSGDASAPAKRCKHHPTSTTHSTAECRHKPSSSQPGAAPTSAKSSAPSAEKEKNVRCFKCNQHGHYANRCPLSAGPSSSSSSSTSATVASGPWRAPLPGSTKTTVKTSTQSSVAAPAAKSAGVDHTDGSVSASTVSLDRTLPAAVWSPPGADPVYLLVDGIMYCCLLDTGADVSFMDKSLADKLKLVVHPIAGKIKLAHGDTRADRIGATDPIEVTALYASPVCPIPAKSFTHSFEVMPLDAYHFIVGKDLIKPILFPDGNLGPFCPTVAGVPATPPSHPSARAASIVDAEGAAGVIDIDTLLAARVSLDEVSLLELDEPVTSPVELDTPPTLEDAYASNRSAILCDPEVRSLLDTNDGIQGFCILPESVVHLDVDPAKVGKLFRKQYPLAHALHPYVTEIVDRWFATGRIKIAPPNCRFNNPLVAVPKKDDNGKLTGVRVCLDTRALNDALLNNDRFQLPNIRHQLELFADSVIFGEVDLQEAYLQFELHVNSQQYTAFTWNGKQYVFIGAPFGITLLGPLFQRVMSGLFSDLPFTFPYLDNLPFGSCSWDDHRIHMMVIIDRLNRANLKVKPSSVKIGQSQMKVLGHIVSSAGIGIDGDKASSIDSWPLPITGEQLESFLGLVKFVGQHIRHFADLTAPLESVKHSKVIEWDDHLRDHFNLVKLAVAKAPALKFPDFNRPFCIAADASNTGIGGALYQPDDVDGPITADNIVTMFSAKLTKCQLNYSAYKKELLALVTALRRFHPYIWGRADVTVFTDHKPLIYMFKSPELSHPLQQWFDVIMDFKFKIKHRPGILNVVPDALSRMYTSLYGESATWGVHNADALASVLQGMGIAGEIDYGFPLLKGGGVAGSSPSVNAISLCGTSLEVELELRGKRAPPTDERAALIETEHLFGHFGRDHIYKSLYNKGYWWSNMREDILAILANCDPCTRYVVTKAGFHPPQAITATGPWSHIQIDCSVHLPKSADGYTALLAIIDVYTSFLLLRPIKTTSADCVAAELWSVFCIMGLPRIVQSDNGVEFVNDIIRAMVKLVGIEHRLISPYNPRADGKVERAIGSVMSIIKKMLHGNTKHWPLFVPFAQLSYNCKMSDLTGSSAFSLMFGRGAGSFADCAADPGAQPLSVEQWQQHQDKMVSLVYPAVADRVKVKKDKMLSGLAQHRRMLLPGAIPNGAIVMLVDPKRENKFDPKYIGPYSVVRRTRAGTYVLKDQTGDILERHVPADKLKLVSSKPRTVDLDSSVYEVQQVLDHRGLAGHREYLVKWKDYHQKTWEPETSFLDTQCIRDYWLAHPGVPDSN